MWLYHTQLSSLSLPQYQEPRLFHLRSHEKSQKTASFQLWIYEKLLQQYLNALIKPPFLFVKPY